MSNNDVTVGYLNEQVATLKSDLKRLRHKYGEFDMLVLDEARHREELAVVTVKRLDKFTDTMQKFLRDKEIMQPETAAHRIRVDQRIARRHQREQSYRELKAMSELRRRVTKAPCSCGRHFGINFYDGREKVFEDLCPETWWIMSSRIANYEGKLREFLDETPFESTKEFLMEGSKDE